MRLVGLVSLLACLLLLTGCGTESPRQAGARVAVQDELSAIALRRRPDALHGHPSAWFVERETTVFVCAASSVTAAATGIRRR